MISWLGTSFKKHNTFHLIFMRALKKPLSVLHCSRKQPSFPVLRFSRCVALCRYVQGADVSSYLRFRSRLSQWWSEHFAGTWSCIKLHCERQEGKQQGILPTIHADVQKRAFSIHQRRMRGDENVPVLLGLARGGNWSRGRPAAICTWDCLKVIQTAGQKTVCVLVCECVCVCVCVLT